MSTFFHLPPSIVTSKEWVTTLIVKAYHEAGNHMCGTNHTLASLSSRYWVIYGHEKIRDWKNQCAECKKRTLKPATQDMALLPEIRIWMRLLKQRLIMEDLLIQYKVEENIGKNVLSLFTCLSMRAVHLESLMGWIPTLFSTPSVE